MSSHHATSIICDCKTAKHVQVFSYIVINVILKVMCANDLLRYLIKSRHLINIMQRNNMSSNFNILNGLS